jgi:hypothetical protein
MCFDDFSERHYHNMTDTQRKQFHDHVKKQYGFSLDNEQCKHFDARFNPENQYKVFHKYLGKEGEDICYLYNEEYHTFKNRYICKDYITKVVRIFDEKVIEISYI